jgi:hypothetical protein
MNTFSINIFDDSDKPSNSSQSDPLLAFRPESTSLNAPDLLPLHNNPDERFRQNRLINGKTKYEEDNTIIKSLEEEIVSMKHKLSFIYEKDEEIAKLKDQVNTLKKQNTELQSGSEAAIKLRIEKKRLEDELDLLRVQSTTSVKLSSENKLLTEKLNELTKKDGDVTTGDGDVPTDEEVEDIDVMINVNVHHLRRTLLNRLKDKQSDHIETLINTYGLKRKNQVKRSVMERMLGEAIHL